MAVDFKTFTQVAPHVLAVKKPVLLRGRHGVGKSEIVYQIADGMGLPVVERRASQMTEGDLIGLPKTDGDVTSFCPPDWFDTACNRGVLLFFISAEVARSFLRLQVRLPLLDLGVVRDPDELRDAGLARFRSLPLDLTARSLLHGSPPLRCSASLVPSVGVVASLLFLLLQGQLRRRVSSATDSSGRCTVPRPRHPPA